MDKKQFKGNTRKNSTTLNIEIMTFKKYPQFNFFTNKLLLACLFSS